MRHFIKAVSRISEGMMWVSGCLMVIMGLATFYDVFMRKLFNAPTAWAFEFNSYLCAAVAFLAGGYALLTERHVRVDIFYMRFTKRTKAIIDLCTSFLFFLLCLVLIWIGFRTALDSFHAGARTGGGLNPPLFLLELLVPAGGVLIGLQGIVRFLGDLQLAIYDKKGGMGK